MGTCIALEKYTADYVVFNTASFLLPHQISYDELHTIIEHRNPTEL